MKSINKVTFSQAVSRRYLTAEARDRAQICPYVICGVHSGTGTRFCSNSSDFPVNIIPLWLSILVYYLGDDQ
jgi:hypothetical protein